MHTKIARWGGSAAIRLPKMALETLGLEEGQSVSLFIDGDRLVLKPACPRYELDALVAEARRLTPPHSLDDEPMGHEAL